jgi:hypothetical protein
VPPDNGKYWIVDALVTMPRELTTKVLYVPAVRPDWVNKDKVTTSEFAPVVKAKAVDAVIIETLLVSNVPLFVTVIPRIYFSLFLY